jgi:hypothetical protein
MMRGTIHRIRVLLLAAGVFAATAAGTEYWTPAGSDLDWFNEDNWNTKVPTADDRAIVGQWSGGIVTAIVGRAGAICDELYVGNGGTDRDGTIMVTNGSLTVDDYLYLGYDGTGRILQTDGTVGVSNSFIVGHQGTGHGTYALQDGSADIRATISYIGFNGTGTLHQTGGTLTANNIDIGYSPTGIGTYEVDGGVQNITSLDVGFDGNASLIVNGGDINCSGVLRLGIRDGSVGAGIQTGGTNTCATLYVGYSPGSRGRLTLSGGRFETANGHIGYAGGNGDVTVTGGTWVASGGISIAGNAASTASLSLVSGTLSIAAGATVLAVGGEGFGTLSMGNSSTSGVITENGAGDGAYLKIRNAAGATGRLSGWGTVQLRKSLENNGIVVADGYGEANTLDFSTMKQVENTIANTSTNGWYAVRKGKLLLPDVTGSGGDYYWGDTDSGHDLVNSVYLDLDTGSGTWTGALLATDHPDVPPDLTAIAVWEFSGISSGSGVLTFIYDTLAAQAASLAETDLVVARHNGTSWINVMASRDTAANTVTTKTVDPTGAFAVCLAPRGTLIILH